MDLLQSFSLRDLLIFSPESYFQLFEISNRALWPFQLPLLLLFTLALVLIYKRPRFTSKLIHSWLGFIWFFVAYWYFNVHYSQISTYAHYLAYAFYVEAFLLFITAFVSRNDAINFDQTDYQKLLLILGVGLITYGLIIHPIMSLLIWNQSLIRAELFSIAPDPTAIASIGFILLFPVKGSLVLIIIPILWLLFSFITYQAF